MRVQLPKPLHGWRMFAGEVGGIVLGVLIALGAQQAVETIHDNAELREAEKAMTAELRDDDLPQAFTRVAMGDCYAAQLDALEAAVAAGDDRSKILEMARAYQPVPRTWDDAAWKAALASQVLAHSDSNRMLSWSSAYFAIPVLANAASEERSELPHLWARMSGTGPISAAQQDRLFDEIAVVRRKKEDMVAVSRIFMKSNAEVGLTLSPEQKAELMAEARRTYGACVKKPSVENLNLETQLPTQAVGD